MKTKELVRHLRREGCRGDSRGPFRSFAVWRRIEPKRAVRDCCFHFLQSGRFRVQSVYSNYLPVSEKPRLYPELRSIELLLETTPHEGIGSFETVEDEIGAVERGFE